MGEGLAELRPGHRNAQVPASEKRDKGMNAIAYRPGTCNPPEVCERVHMRSGQVICLWERRFNHSSGYGIAIFAARKLSRGTLVWSFGWSQALFNCASAFSTNEPCRSRDQLLVGAQ